ncbi:RagB/SusD family nutrient uptake outer membrane protein [Echinicola sp. CAU 1574]|uniref:RagB/SusD family nutrient uptake outer membrane protein n=1 Tax=Echinicola arenosa TaxID=2774144 RepID=A0ABR9AGC8_9BACT|nr:RagB/SusD family nutrient uptake outer membrane protein [Echinicola arenosa]MBD8487798.1 RagB/SusD family nutrient uptake outer membrane protein [Echinicola arenosa]
MKYLNNKYWVGLVMLVLAACDIDRSPYDSITADDLQSSESSAQSVTLGTYSRMKDWSDNWHRLYEYPSDNLALSGTTTDPLFFSYNYQRIPNGSRVAGFWRSSYQIIVGANKTIEALEEGASDANDQLLAENYYIRALMHFQLVNIFGRPYVQGRDNPGVPLKLDGDHLNHPTRSTVGEVYDQVEADLIKSASLFKEDKSNVYATKEAVWALLSRVYLYEEENAKAIEYADMVIDSGKFSLLATEKLADYTKLAPESNSETIFAIKFIPDADYASNGWYTVGSLYANIQGTGWGEMYASRPYLEMVREYPEDERYKFIKPVVVDESITWALYVDNANTYKWKEVTQSGADYTYTENGQAKMLEKVSNGHGGYDYFVETSEGSKKVLIDKKLDLRNGFPKYYVLKCSGQEDQVHLWSPVISRLAEMYLNRAEANAKLGNATLALDDVNLIRERAGIPEVGLYTMANLGDKSVLDAVLEERQLELAFEGHRKIDVFRNDRTMDRAYPGTHLAGNSPVSSVSPDDNAVIEYIPEAQLLVHEGLTQNP